MKTIVAFVTSLSLAACAPLRVGVDFDRNADFTGYETYAWGPHDTLPTGDPRLDNNPFFDSRVRQAVEQQLTVKGLAKAAQGSPDLLIHYHASVQERMDVYTVDREYGYGSETETFVYEEGTLLVDVADATSKRIIWRGWAQSNIEGVIDNPERMEKRINEAVARMFESFPPR